MSISAEDELMTLTEVAKLFRVQRSTVSRWCTEGKIRSIRTLGGHRRLYKQDVMKLLERQSDGSYGK